MDTTHVIVWIVIILVAILLIWLLRKWIKRLIFIILILWLAFFIYGLFNPSWASRLWYNVRTLPDRVVSRFSNQTFVDYDSYKWLKDEASSVWDKIDLNLETEESDKVEEEKTSKESKEQQKLEEKFDSESEETIEEKIQVASSFSSHFSKINFATSALSWKKQSSSSNELNHVSDEKIMRALEEYLWKNLDEDTDILVTVEYPDGGERPEKIILQTQDKTHSAAVKRVVRKPWFTMFHWARIIDEWNKDTTVNSWEIVENLVQVKESSKNVSATTKTYNGLTQKEIRETEELFSILLQ